VYIKPPSSHLPSIPTLGDVYDVIKAKSEATTDVLYNYKDEKVR